MLSPRAVWCFVSMNAGSAYVSFSIPRKACPPGYGVLKGEGGVGILSGLEEVDVRGCSTKVSPSIAKSCRVWFLGVRFFLQNTKTEANELEFCTYTVDTVDTGTVTHPS